eukprot:1052270-Pleurochrysis_carterae.AAC.3
MTVWARGPTMSQIAAGCSSDSRFAQRRGGSPECAGQGWSPASIGCPYRPGCTFAWLGLGLGLGLGSGLELGLELGLGLGLGLGPGKSRDQSASHGVRQAPSREARLAGLGRVGLELCLALQHGLELRSSL